MSDTNKKSGGSARASSPAQAAHPAKKDAGGAKGAAAADGPGKFWVNWFDPRALAVLGVLLIALCCVAAVIALWANNAAQPVAITRPAQGAALDPIQADLLRLLTPIMKLTKRSTRAGAGTLVCPPACQPADTHFGQTRLTPATG